MNAFHDEVRAGFDGAIEDVVVHEGFGPLAIDVPDHRWTDAAGLARDVLGCTFFDFLTAVDEAEAGFRLVCHVARPAPGVVDHLVLRTLVEDRVASVAHVYAGATWHERETAEMFGIVFTDPEGRPMTREGLLLPEQFVGHPLRKDFVLASRVARPWPGSKEPGESDSTAAPSRRRTRPPGVPDGWGS